MTQPRYFCTTCHRYWTQGGTLHRVPVGGSRRKNKRNSAASSSSSTTAGSSNTDNSVTNKIISSSTNQLMMMMPTPMMMMDFPSVLPTFVSTAASGSSFEENNVSLPFAPLSSLSSNEATGGSRSRMTTSFLDMLRRGFLDGSNNSIGSGQWDADAILGTTLMRDPSSPPCRAASSPPPQAPPSTPAAPATSVAARLHCHR